jgi:hypothetical protein
MMKFNIKSDHDDESISYEEPEMIKPDLPKEEYVYDWTKQK